MNETRNSMLKRNIQLVAAIGALAAVTAVGAVAQSGDGTNGSPGDDVAQVTTVEPEARAAASVLARPRAAGDALPAEVEERMNAHPRFGMNPGLSRRAIGGLSNSVYLIPASGFVCAALTVGDGANMSCAETSDLAAGQSGPSTVSLAGGAIAVYGMVPDGVDSVAVATDDRSAGATKVVNNAFFTVLPAGTGLKTVSYRGPSGPVQYPIYDPSAP
jgi:hypothetical protein